MLCITRWRHCYEQTLFSNQPSNNMNQNKQKQQTGSLPPPLFANQRSNLSALASSMGSFSAEISSSNTVTQQTKEYHTQQAQAFLNQQHDRITRIEEDLLKATEDLLPMDTKCMTVTELLGVCSALQQTNVELMKQLDMNMNRHYNGNYNSVLTEERCQACMVVREEEPSPPQAPPNTPWQFSATTLEQVVETDNETDATTTPGSSVFFSPPLSLSSDSKNGGDTPVTPSLENLHLSSNTAAVLKETSLQEENDDASQSSKRHSLDAIEAWRARKYSLSFAKPPPNVNDDENTVKEEVSARDESVKPPTVDNETVPKSTAGVRQAAALPSANETTTATLTEPKEDAKQTRVPPSDTALEEEHADEVSVASSSTTTASGEERPTDSSTIVGCGDLTFADDDTAVATIATVLGRGRQRNLTIPNIPEDDVLKTRVSSYAESKIHGVRTLESSAPVDPDRVLDLTSERSPAAPVQAVDTTIVGMNETLMDDETVVEANQTVISRSRRRGTATSFSPKREQPSDEISTDMASSMSPGEHAVKEIIVDTSATSCSMDCHHDNTVSSDVSVLDSSSTLASPRSIAARQTEDETTVGSLLVTPVLDRYRLEADDTSIGVKVVPNERRGAHHEVPKQKQRNLLTKYGAAASRPTVAQQAVSHPKTPKANDVDTLPKSSPFVTQRTRTVYRKTPHPKKAGSSSQVTTDENARPNVEDGRTPLKSDQHGTAPKPRRESLQSPFTRISLPELTQRPYRTSMPSTARRLPFSATKPRSERRHTISFKQQQQTPLTAAWIAKHMPEQKSNLVMDSLDVSDADSSFTFD